MVRTILSLQFESSCQASATLLEQCDGVESIARVRGVSHGRQRRLFAIFENYLANGSPGLSADPPVVIYAANYTLFVRAGPHQSQRPSEKRGGYSHWGLGDVDRYRGRAVASSHALTGAKKHVIVPLSSEVTVQGQAPHAHHVTRLQSLSSEKPYRPGPRRGPFTFEGLEPRE